MQIRSYSKMGSAIQRKKSVKMNCFLITIQSSVFLIVKIIRSKIIQLKYVKVYRIVILQMSIKIIKFKMVFLLHLCSPIKKLFYMNILVDFILLVLLFKYCKFLILFLLMNFLRIYK
ncbi:transmembrane protein, putative (macronuclear) [Tetrahymena thermophila SB210]|uniref:Transmembrane protein, putative n=1 Tax=Tetrahymena thermophila (strain SB210) TaxID=312017 RepID=W7WW04_TETTS|nr:transmembrane protein, putative [Tetrahymena thermophila SB210]EWS71010.1 transmembrane protein, putative [Tetrahymena thermophila SB210]|eukprot:XP_012656451.1 transmembrane protein, putative [Tetrahymena thermophila SB210]